MVRHSVKGFTKFTRFETDYVMIINNFNLYATEILTTTLVAATDVGSLAIGRFPSFFEVLKPE